MDMELPSGRELVEEIYAKKDAEIAVLREQNRVLVEALQTAKYELAALFPIPSAPTVHAALKVCGNNNEADARCIYLAYEAICAALTATSQPTKPQGRMHACDIPGCVSCGNPEDTTSQEGQHG